MAPTGPTATPATPAADVAAQVPPAPAAVADATVPTPAAAQALTVPGAQGPVQAAPSVSVAGAPLPAPTGVDPALRGQELSVHANAADQLFALEAALDAQAELDAARVAQSQAQSAPVRQFAAHILDEHTRSQEMLRAIATAGNASLAVSPDPAYQRVIEELGRLHGEGFDLGYLRAEVAAQQRAVELCEWIISSGQQPSIKGYAVDALPKVLQQLEAAQVLLAQLDAGSD
jgi:putative membrane protein